MRKKKGYKSPERKKPTINSNSGLYKKKKKVNGIKPRPPSSVSREPRNGVNSIIIIKEREKKV
jgi:hypothetical protein